MSQHRKDTPDRQNRLWVGLNMFASGVSSSLVIRLVKEPVWGEAHVVGVVFGSFTASLFAAWSFQALARHGEARRNRARRMAWLAEQEEREAAERAATTGTWVGAEPGQVLSVRWDADEHTFRIQGWIGGNWTIEHERPWFDPATLKDKLALMESSAQLWPMSGPGTDLVRARLDLPEWKEPAASHTPDATPAAEKPEVHGETVRLVNTGRWRTSPDHPQVTPQGSGPGVAGA